MKYSKFLLAWLAVVAAVSGGFCAADEPEAVKSIERFNLSTGGTGLYRPNKWGLIRVGLRNPHDRDVELLATTYFVGDPTLQYGRRFWMPGQSRMSTWHPLKMPALETPDQEFFDLRSMVLNSSEAGESMTSNEFGAQQFDQGFRVAKDESVTAMIIDPLVDGAQRGPDWASPQDFALTARFDRGLRHNFTLLSDPLFPAGEELLDALDHLVIASDRLLGDSAGIAAIRRWVAAGGRLWIMADRVSPPLLAALLGDDDTVIEVDRVDLTNPHITAGAWSIGDMPFDRELEIPVRFVRVIAEGLDVDFLVNGWPAAFHRTYGDGRILVTTLGADGWLRPRAVGDPSPPGGQYFQTKFTPSAALSHLSLEFFTPHSTPLIPRELAEEQVRQMIGYSIPSRTLVLGTLSAFTGLMLVIAVWAARRGRLEWMGLAIPGLAILSSGVLLAAGWNSRSTIPASTAIIQTVHAVPGTTDIRTSGLVGVFAKESQSLPLAGTDGGWTNPEMQGLEGKTRRLVWSDIDSWKWENFSFRPGLRMVAFQTAGHVQEPVDAVVQFDAQGIRGKVVLPPDLKASDALIVTPQGRLGAQIQADGTLVSAADDVLTANQYVSAKVLSDEQQRRNRMLSQMFVSDPEETHAQTPVLLLWTKPWDVGTSVIQGADRVGSALVSIPLRWERPAAGTPITVPATFLPFREIMGPDGVAPTGMYDYRHRRWVERSGKAAAWLGFTLPGNLLPVDVKSATITLKVLGPMGRVELSTFEDNQHRSLKVWEAPVGTLTHEITDLKALTPDSRGRLLLRLDVGQAATEPEPKPGSKNLDSLSTKDPLSYWQFEDVSLQIAAEIPSPK